MDDDFQDIMSQTKARTRANYDRLSRWYDLIAGSSERAIGLRGLALLDPRPGERALEIGAGTGALLAELARRVGPDGAAWGVDLSPGMCRVARARLARARASPSVAAICGDAERLPFPAGAFDAIFMSFTLELFDDAEMATVLDECQRILRAGGRLGVVALAEAGRSGLMARLYAWAHRRFPALVDCRPIQSAHILAEHGFRVVEVTRGALWGLPLEIVLSDED